MEVSPSIKRTQALQGGVGSEMGSIHVAETSPGARELLVKLSDDDAVWIILNLETGQARQVATPAEPVKLRYDSDKERGCIREGDTCTMLPFDVGGGGFTRISWDGQFVATGTFEATTAPGGFFPSWGSLFRSHTGTFSINAYLIKDGPSAPPVVRLSGGWTGRGRDNPWDGLVWVDGRRFIVPVNIHTFRFLFCDVLKESA